MTRSPETIALEAAKQWAMKEKIPTEYCTVVYSEEGDLLVHVRDAATATIRKRELEQYPSLVPQFVGERLTRNHRQAAEARSRQS